MTDWKSLLSSAFGEDAPEAAGRETPGAAAAADARREAPPRAGAGAPPRPCKCPSCGGGSEAFFYTVHGWWRCRSCFPPGPGEEAEPPALPEEDEGRLALLDEAARALEALYARLAEDLPPGLRPSLRDRRPDLLAAVEQADAALDEALARLEESGSAEALDRAKEAAAALEAAWRRAADAFADGLETVESEAGGGPDASSEARPGGSEEADPVCGAAVSGGESRQGEPQPPEGEPTLAGSEEARQLALKFEGGESGAGPASVSPWEGWLAAVEIEEVRTLDGWRRALAEARAAGVCGIDTETTGLDPLVHRIRLVQLAVPVYPGSKRLVAEDGRGPEPGSGARVYILDLFALPEEGRREALEGLAALFADRGVVKAGHNLKFDLAFLRAALGRRLAAERMFDAMLASQLCAAGDFVPGGRWEKWCEEHGLAPAKNVQGQELKSVRVDAHGHLVVFEHDSQKEVRPFFATHSLQQVAHRHLEVWLEKEHQAADWSGELAPEMVRYAALDAAVLLPLREILVRLLSLNRLVGAAKIEFGCLPAVAEIELSGMPFDAGRARAMLEEAAGRAAALRRGLAAQARAAGFWPAPKKSSAGGAKKPEDAWLNPDSGIDCVGCLRLMAQAEGALAEGGRAFFVSGEELPLDSRDETLSRLAARLPEGSALRRFAEGLRAYRAAKKRADFLKKWLELAHDADDRLHPDLRQINPQGVGRFSASNPNLQQAPRGSEIRSLFRAPAGKRLVLGDFNAVEMRIMGQLSGDENLIAAFREGADVHRRTAAAMAGKAEDQVTKEERQAAKAFNFGLIYGMSAKTLQLYAETNYNAKLNLEEAEAARRAFFRIYPGVAAWHRRQDRRGYEDGFEDFWRHDFERGFYKERRPCVRTLGGRLRVWPVVEEKRKDGEGTRLRKAGSFTELYNSADQGSGADLIKIAMGLLYQEFLRRGWEDVFLVGSVHDELILEAPEALAQEAAEVLESVMIEAGRRIMPDVPVEVEVTAAESWADKA